MADLCAAVVDLCFLRVTKLEAGGAPLVGATSVYSTTMLSQATRAFTVDEGDSLITRNGCGDIMVNRPAEPRITGATLTITGEQFHPELEGAIFGDNVLLRTTDAVGTEMASVGAAAPDGVAVEIWQKCFGPGGAQLVDAVSSQPLWLHWLWPRVISWRRSDQTLGGGQTQFVYAGTATENTEWETGEGHAIEFDVEGLEAKWIEDDALPTATCGLTALAAGV